jgi:hypothetical protein
MKKTESVGLIRRARAFALLAGLTSLLLLLPAAGSAANAYDYEIGAIPVQDTVKYNKSLRTFVTDPSDGVEKKIELRYQDEVLTDVLIDGKRLKKEDYQKHEKIIRKAEAEIVDINRDASAAKEEIRRAMDEVMAIDLDAIWKDIQIDIADIMADIATGEHRTIIVDTDIDTRIDSGDTLSPAKKEKMHKRLEELEAGTKTFS